LFNPATPDRDPQKTSLFYLATGEKTPFADSLVERVFSHREGTHLTPFPLQIPPGHLKLLRPENREVQRNLGTCSEGQGLAWSPDSRELLTVESCSHGFTGTLARADVATGVRKRIQASQRKVGYGLWLNQVKCGLGQSLNTLIYASRY
jgi:hypothetical protein